MAKSATTGEPARARKSEAQTARPIEAYGAMAHTVSGRTRVRLKPELRTPEAMAQIKQSLNDHEHVSDVTINERTGSVVVTHARHRSGRELFEEALGEVELLGAAVLELPGEESEGEDRFAKLDQQLANVVYNVDYAVWKKTGLHFRGQILSGGIAALGVAQMFIYGISLEMISGPFLLWIAYDIYHREVQEPPFEERYRDEMASVEAPPEGAAQPAAA